MTNNDDHHDHEGGPRLGILLVGLAATAAWFDLSPVFALAGLAAGGWPIFREALQNLLHRRMTMELSMSIAIVAAAAITEYFTALVITFFVLVAEELEGLTVARGREAIHDLLDFLTRKVRVRRDGEILEVTSDELATGEAVLVDPGGLIPVDGSVTAGHSFVDQARITGESMPVEKTAGSPVFAGTINQSGALEIRTERIGRDTSFGKIVEAVEQAERSRAPVQRLADRIAGYLVGFALGAALITYFLTRDIRATISVVIVAGACGIAAGTPLAILGAIGRAARAGAIVKGGLFLEQLGRVDTVLFDKTGTLTLGQPEILQASPASTLEDLLNAAMSAELRSEHPVGRAIVSYARQQGLSAPEPETFQSIPGRGVVATLEGEMILVGNQALLRDHGVEPADLPGEVLVARAGRVLGSIQFKDRVRPEARPALDKLHSLGLRTCLLTGDAEPVAQAVAAELGVREVVANLLPDQKREVIRNLTRSGRVVAMVGDGVNDAPALIEADVGIAMGSGTDVARESADVVLLGNDLLKLVETLVLARRTRRIIWANFAGTIAVDSLGILLAALGLLNPLLAAFIHVASELAFILNSARLVATRPAK